uniref:Putative secreted protein n=1 Tax=Ixodes ricinus TaxID=34613 RepID=A0A6B0U9G7_IXORI
MVFRFAGLFIVLKIRRSVHVTRARRLPHMCHVHVHYSSLYFEWAPQQDVTICASAKKLRKYLFIGPFIILFLWKQSLITGRYLQGGKKARPSKG